MIKNELVIKFLKMLFNKLNNDKLVFMGLCGYCIQNNLFDLDELVRAALKVNPKEMYNLYRKLLDDN